MKITVSKFTIKVIIGKYDVSDKILSIRTQKNINQKGSWQISLRPIRTNEMGVINSYPFKINDPIEIYCNGKILIRGLVDGLSIFESAEMGKGNTVTKSITVGGSDVLKILETTHLIVPPDSYTVEALAAKESLTELFNQLFPKESVQQGLSTWINTLLQYGLKYAINNTNSLYKISTNIEKVQSSAGSTSDEKFQVILNILTRPNKGGTLLQYFLSYIKRPLFEIFCQDEEEETSIVVRWCRYERADGLWPQQGESGIPWFPAPAIKNISNATIIQSDFRKNDFDRYTYFLTQASNLTVQSDLETPAATAALIDVMPNGGTYRNPYYDGEGIKKFGYKELRVVVPYFSVFKDVEGSDPTNLYIMEVAGMLKDINKWLVDVFSFTDELYNGTIVFAGTTDIKIGDWILLPNRFIVYVEHIEHNIDVMGQPSWTTRITFTRGRRQPFSAKDQIIETEKTPSTINLTPPTMRSN